MERPTESLVRRLRSWWPWRRRAAARALGSSGDARAVEPLIRALSDRNRGVRCAAAGALGRVGDDRAITPLARCLAHMDAETRQAAARALAGTPSVREVVHQLRALVRAGFEKPQPDVGPSMTGPPLPPTGLLARMAAVGPAGSRWAPSGAIIALEEEGGRLIRRLSEYGHATERVVEVVRGLDDERAIDPLVKLLCKQDRQRHPNALRAATAALGELSAGRERRLARAALDHSVQVDLGLSLRRFGRLMAGEPEYTICFPEVRAALLEMGQDAVQGLLAAVNLQEPKERRAVANLLRSFGDRSVASAVLRVLYGPDVAPRRAVRALWYEMPPLWLQVTARWADSLSSGHGDARALLSARDPWVCLWAADALGLSGRRDGRERARVLLSGRDADGRVAGAVLLAHRGEQAALKALLEALPGQDSETRLIVACALGRMGGLAGPALAGIQELQGSDSRPDARCIYREAAESIRRALRDVPAELVAAEAPAGLGTELEAAEAPAGTGTELEAAAAPAGTGTELEAAADRDAPDAEPPFRV